MSLFDAFLERYPPADDLVKPTGEVLEQFCGILPPELLDFWQEYGFGSYGGGLLKVVDPTTYADGLYTWLGGEDPSRQPVLVTAFGNIFYYRKLSETADDVCLLDIHHRQILTCTYSFAEFFERFITDGEVVEELLNRPLFAEALQKKGPLGGDEIYAFVPALILGGSETADHLDKCGAAAHQQLLFQLGQ